MDQYRQIPQLRITFDDMIIDNFAGGGGASTGIEAAMGRPVDIAINHDPDSIAMHKINHPATKHLCENVWDVDPRKIAEGRPVALCWFSPDCKHFSKAKGGKPVEKNIRGLAWVAVRYAATVKPRVIMLENVEEFKTWGPIVDGLPCKKRKGETFDSFVRALEKHGYKVETKTMRASDYGVPTIRKRLFMVARCDGLPIVWPEATHGDPSKTGFRKSGLKPWKTAASIIDWSIPCPSIFERKRPLAENTLRRIVKGIRRYVIDSSDPYIVEADTGVVQPFITEHANASNQRNMPADEPLRTVCAQVKGGHFALCTALLAKHFGGNYNGAGASLTDPVPTVTSVDHNALVAANLVHLRNNCDARSLDAPVPTLTAGGGHVAEVRAFLVKYYSEGGQWQDLKDPMHTIPTKDRLGLVTVRGEQYQIVDIGMRMLEPHELFAAQGFPKNYIIGVDAAGKKIPKYKQVARCGNSVPPKFAEVLVRANVTEISKNVKAA